MKEKEDCFLKVKKDYLRFLNKEKIFNKSEATKIESLKRIYIPMSFWIEKKYRKKGKDQEEKPAGVETNKEAPKAEAVKAEPKKEEPKKE